MTYNAEMGYNIIPENLGALKRINSSGAVEELGSVWHTDRPYNVFPTRMLSIDGDLHLCVGYGNGDEILRYNSPPSQADNMVHIVYGKTLHYVLPRFQLTESVYAALADLAKRVNATLSFEKNIIMISDRRPYRAVTDGDNRNWDGGHLAFSDANKTFPSSGLSADRERDFEIHRYHRRRVYRDQARGIGEYDRSPRRRQQDFVSRHPHPDREIGEPV